MKLSRISLLLGLAAVSFTACDNIDENERFDFKEPITVADNKNVLVEDFTGQKCINCPKAADEIHQMQQTFGADRLISVAIHGGAMGAPEDLSNPKNQGLANPTGIAYHEYWGIKSWPKGLVDRSGDAKDYEQWQAVAVERFKIKAKVNLDVKVAYDAQTRQATIQTKIEGNEDADGKLQVWLTESNLTRLQFMPDGSKNKNYVHNHVFRASVNDPYGDAMQIKSGEEKVVSHSYTLQNHWTPENMAAVVFFYNEKDGVMQVVDAHVVD